MDISHRAWIAALIASLSLLGAACTAEGEVDDGGVEAEIEGEDNGGDDG